MSKLGTFLSVLEGSAKFRIWRGRYDTRNNLAGTIERAIDFMRGPKVMLSCINMMHQIESVIALTMRENEFHCSDESKRIVGYAAFVLMSLSVGLHWPKLVK
jgi:hypothetical protein